MGCAVDRRSTFRGMCNRQPTALWILMGGHMPCFPVAFRHAGGATLRAQLKKR